MTQTQRHSVTIIGLLLCLSADLPKTQTYECPVCHRQAAYTEDSPKVHYCTGDPDHPHAKTSMTHTGEHE
jgi:hypothetical protein